MRIDVGQFRQIVAELHVAGYAADDIAWSENAGPPADADDFALEAAFVICNSGMKNTVARGIYDRVRAALEAGKSAGAGFGHPGKVSAIDAIWNNRAGLYADFSSIATDVERLDWLGRLPWIGEITKYHLAKNFGVDVAKPDVHLQRLADRGAESVQVLCERLARSTGYRIATVDVLLWRACAIGIIDSRTGVFMRWQPSPSSDLFGGGE